MTIFHVLKYPVPNWQTEDPGEAIPEFILEKFFIEARIIGNTWMDNLLNDIHTGDLDLHYSKIYIRLLTEYEGTE